MWGMVVTSTFDLLWPYLTLQHTGPRIVCNVGGRLVPHRNTRRAPTPTARQQVGLIMR